ncbi:guanylate kinase [bacterium]|nr:MAG: guanylate kinase [bacterium]
MANKNQRGILFVISAPSGGGKTSLANAVIKKLNPQISLEKVATYTTRPSRINEQNGKDYYFVSRPQFLKKIEDGFFLETTEYNGELYGSPASITTDLRNGKSLILVTDWDGAKKIRNFIDQPVLLWIMPPSIEILKERIQKRGTETREQIESRLKLANIELEHELINKIFTHHILNDNFEQAVDEIAFIIRQKLNH